MVQDTKGQVDQRNDELLSSFNVATFKSDEDDAAFWNRLIPQVPYLLHIDRYQAPESAWRSCLPGS